ncbi:protein of unknown function [Thermoactinomyces sp. DSM 45891]|uniref:DUF932 domain-containing protein n=1 Tax=Thermoactinomyces sp. DSM 45891 TaxID=1761907 RepID=UPI0009122AFC|nr:DUF932 domain-containing protein [Thermoactinomyces sp. DSM 45891]SFX74990.1 protein of unknown function [Thermoactinomyces sp. DSM 45891]
MLTTTSANRLQQILKGLETEDTQKEDLIISASDLTYREDGLLYDRYNRINGYSLNDWSTGQFAQRLNIPSRYFKSCPPELRSINAAHWMQKLEPDTDWMLRTMKHGVVRGLMSDKYVPFDDLDILDVLNEILKKSGAEYKIEMWNRDDSGCHLRITFPDLTTSVGKLENGNPDTHLVGFHLMNSEVGKSSIRISPMVYRQICTNGLMGWRKNGDAFQQRHIHLRHNEIYTRVLEAVGQAIQLGESMINELLKAKETEVENPLAIIKKLANDNKYSQKFTNTIQDSFAREQGNTAFHVVQSLTLAAQTLDTDSRTEIERTASRLLSKLVA